jgi:hypothetical protein
MRNDGSAAMNTDLRNDFLDREFFTLRLKQESLSVVAVKIDQAKIFIIISDPSNNMSLMDTREDFAKSASIFLSVLEVLKSLMVKTMNEKKMLDALWGHIRWYLTTEEVPNSKDNEIEVLKKSFYFSQITQISSWREKPEILGIINKLNSSSASELEDFYLKLQEDSDILPFEVVSCDTLESSHCSEKQKDLGSSCNSDINRIRVEEGTPK